MGISFFALTTLAASLHLFFSHSVSPCVHTQMEKARRRRRVPAFGEWNYYYYSGEISTPAPVAAAEWYAPAREAEACSDVWFRYSPPPTGSRKKARRPETDKSFRSGKRRTRAATPARASDAVDAPKAARTTPATAKASAAAAARVVRSVDADLYRVPPPEFEADEPRRRKASRSAWFACFGFSCCVA